mmetsp:Transcript_45039/g.108054  ORF Transcript_45039/g.108054 Transcript_45039/m.108054 type:complete len:245 (-) Transcript_45039:832-1566(-)
MRQHRCCDRLESTRLRCTLHAAAMLFAPRLIVRDPADGMQRPAALVLHLLLRVCAHCCHHRLQRVCLHCLLPAVVRGVAGAAIAQAHKCVAAGALALTTSPQLRVCRHSCYNRPQCARLHCSLPDNLRRVANVRQHREAGGLHLHHLRVRPQRRHHRLQCARLCCTPPARLYRTILASTDVGQCPAASDLHCLHLRVRPQRRHQRFHCTCLHCSLFAEYTLRARVLSTTPPTDVREHHAAQDLH